MKAKYSLCKYFFLRIWLILSSFLLSGYGAAGMVHNSILEIILIFLAFPKGKICERYGSWEPYNI